MPQDGEEASPLPTRLNPTRNGVLLVACASTVRCVMWRPNRRMLLYQYSEILRCICDSVPKEPKEERSRFASFEVQQLRCNAVLLTYTPRIPGLAYNVCHTLSHYATFSVLQYCGVQIPYTSNVRYLWSMHGINVPGCSGGDRTCTIRCLNLAAWCTEYGSVLQYGKGS